MTRPLFDDEFMEQRVVGALMLMLSAGCSASPIESLNYDMSKSGAVMTSSDGAFPETLNSCWLGGEKLSVFVGHVQTIGAIETGLMNCPDPTYFTDHRVAGIDVIDTAVGRAPQDDDAFHLVGSTGIPLVLVEAGDDLLMAARWWPPTNAWIVTEIVGVDINGSTTATADPTPERAIDLPTNWADLVTELKQSRASSCTPKALHGVYDDAEFDEQVLRRGKASYDRECSGQTPQPEMPMSRDTDPTEGDE